MVVLIHQGVKVALSMKDKKLVTMKDSKWKDTDQNALFIIQLCIIDDVL